MESNQDHNIMIWYFVEYEPQVWPRDKFLFLLIDAKPSRELVFKEKINCKYLVLKKIESTSRKMILNG